MHSDRLTPAPLRIPQPSESPEELEKIAESIKDRYRSYREARESLDDQVFQITVTVRLYLLEYYAYLMTLSMTLSAWL